MAGVDVLDLPGGRIQHDPADPPAGLGVARLEGLPDDHPAVLGPVRQPSGLGGLAHPVAALEDDEQAGHQRRLVAVLRRVVVPLLRRVVRFGAGPFARFSASRSAARSAVIASTVSDRGTVTLYSPSVM